MPQLRVKSNFCFILGFFVKVKIVSRQSGHTEEKCCNRFQICQWLISFNATDIWNWETFWDGNKPGKKRDFGRFFAIVNSGRAGNFPPLNHCYWLLTPSTVTVWGLSCISHLLRAITWTSNTQWFMHAINICSSVKTRAHVDTLLYIQNIFHNLLDNSHLFVIVPKGLRLWVFPWL